MTLRLALLTTLVACGEPQTTPAFDAGGGKAAAKDAAPAPGPDGVADAAADPAAGPGSEDDKVLYALGQSVGMSLGPFHLSPAELAQVQKGLEDQIAGRPSAVPLEVYGPKIRDLGLARAEAAAKANAVASAAFLQQLGQTPGAAVSPTGVVYVELQAGNGPSAKATDVVTVHYRGTLADGTEFDSSYARGEPAQFPLGEVIPCWTEGIQKMKVGAKAKLGCPPNLAYGDHGQGDIPPGAALLFEVELLGVTTGS